MNAKQEILDALAIAEVYLNADQPFTAEARLGHIRAILETHTLEPIRGGLLAECARLIDTAVSGENCGDCDNVGFYTEADHKGNPVQVQCQFCYTVPWSKFNVEALKDRLKLLGVLK